MKKTNHHHPIKKTIRTFKRKKTFSFLFHCLKYPTSTPYSDTKPRHPDTAKNFILAFFLIFKFGFVTAHIQECPPNSFRLAKKSTRNRTKLVVLCDVSKSMEFYSAFLLQFMFAFQQVYNKIETFAFSTSLQCITGLLKQIEFKDALSLLAGQNSNRSGGTGIGESLDQFVKDHLIRVADKRSIVVILSDGWDTGNINLLQQSMQAIQARVKKFIWLNPLAGYRFISRRWLACRLQCLLWMYLHLFTMRVVCASL